MKRTITIDHQRWLGGELQAWQRQGLIDDATALAIADGYDVVPGKRLSLSTLLLTLGAIFVGVGVLWLIAANLDALSPMVRLAAVLALFAAALIGAEVLAGRREHGGHIPSPVVGGMRLLASLLLGGVIFQAAQSLQVPAFEPLLGGLWAIGAFLYAYLMRAVMPLVVGVLTGSNWLISELTFSDDLTGLSFTLAMFAAAVLAIGLAHLPSPQASFRTVWRETGAVLALIGLFAAAIPDVTVGDFSWNMPLVLVGVLAIVAAGLALRHRTGWIELGTALGITALGVLMVFWEAGRDADNVDLASWAHAALAVGVYVGAALWVAYLGIVHDSQRLTIVATGALVVFTTFQAFAVFAAIIQGAWLFVVLGLVLAGSGYLFDRARRELAATVADDSTETTEGATS